jgi:hypothetical protein
MNKELTINIIKLLGDGIGVRKIVTLLKCSPNSIYKVKKHINNHMKPFNTYEDMENGDYEPENIPSKKDNELYNGLKGSGIPTGYMGEIYLGDGMVIKPNGKIEKE